MPKLSTRILVILLTTSFIVQPWNPHALKYASCDNEIGHNITTMAIVPLSYISGAINPLTAAGLRRLIHSRSLVMAPHYDPDVIIQAAISMLSLHPQLTSSDRLWALREVERMARTGEGWVVQPPPGSAHYIIASIFCDLGIQTNPTIIRQIYMAEGTDFPGSAALLPDVSPSESTADNPLLQLIDEAQSPNMPKDGDNFQIAGVNISLVDRISGAPGAEDGKGGYNRLTDRILLNIPEAFAHPDPGYSPEETIDTMIRHELAHERFAHLTLEAQLELANAFAENIGLDQLDRMYRVMMPLWQHTSAGGNYFTIADLQDYTEQSEIELQRTEGRGYKAVISTELSDGTRLNLQLFIDELFAIYHEGVARRLRSYLSLDRLIPHLLQNSPTAKAAGLLNGRDDIVREVLNRIKKHPHYRDLFVNARVVPREEQVLHITDADEQRIIDLRARIVKLYRATLSPDEQQKLDSRRSDVQFAIAARELKFDSSPTPEDLEAALLILESNPHPRNSSNNSLHRIGMNQSRQSVHLDIGLLQNEGRWRSQIMRDWIMKIRNTFYQYLSNVLYSAFPSDFSIANHPYLTPIRIKIETSA